MSGLGSIKKKASDLSGGADAAYDKLFGLGEVKPTPVVKKVDPQIAINAKKAKAAKQAKEDAAQAKFANKMNEEYKGMSKLDQMIAADKAKQAKKGKM